MSGPRPRGPLIGWQARTKRQVGILADLVARFDQHNREGTLPRGPRGIFYDLRPNGMGNGVTYRKEDSLHPIKPTGRLPGFGPMEAHPAAVQEVLQLARRAEIIPEHFVADGRAPFPMKPFVDNDDAKAQAGYLVAALSRRRVGPFDRQRYQPCYIEVLCEAEDLMPRLARIAGEKGVPVYSGSGFDGLKGKREFAERAMERDRPTVVINIGDCDKYGGYIFNAAAEDAIAWAQGEGKIFPIGTPIEDVDCEVENWLDRPRLLFVRLALTVEQAQDLDLLDADGKAEVDGVPVPVMDTWLREAIEALQDPESLDRLLEEERKEQKKLPAAIRKALRQAGYGSRK
jgi:hypothetical protein